MRVLLDTHIAVWLAFDEAALTAGERKIFADHESKIAVSAVTLWELRLKWNSLHPSGARKGPADPELLVEIAQQMGWELLPLTPEHAVAPLTVKLPHKDPFDELLLVQAQEEGMRLLTRDARLLGHPVAIA